MNSILQSRDSEPPKNLTKKVKPKSVRLINEPHFGLTRNGESPYKPTLREVFVELWENLNCFKNSKRTPNTAAFLFHLFTQACFLALFLKYFSIASLAFTLFCSVVIIATLYHTIWIHNYCSHQSFKFSSNVFNKFFLWTNPIFISEQGYAITHFYHHKNSDEIGDPHGPHLGWIGNHFAVDSFLNFNSDIDATQYKRMQRIVQHIGFKMNSYEDYQRTGSVENLNYFVMRTIFAHLLWNTIAYAIGGIAFVIAWNAAICNFNMIFRDFGWRGHGGQRKAKVFGWEFETKTSSLNQYFYGYLASEWHDNHHHFPTSANYGFLPGQFQLSFQMIRLFKKMDIISHYNDFTEEFQATVYQLPENYSSDRKGYT